MDNLLLTQAKSDETKLKETINAQLDSVKNQLDKLESSFRSLGLAEDTVRQKTAGVLKAFDSFKERVNLTFDKDSCQDLISLNDTLKRELDVSSNEYDKLLARASEVMSVQQRLSKAEEFEEIAEGFQKSETSMGGMQKLAVSFKKEMSQAAQALTQWLSLSSGLSFLVSKAKSAISELKGVDTLLTEIGKSNAKLSDSDLDNIRADSFEAAGKYGKKPADYLSGVQAASHAGYENPGEIAELSLAAQSAGGMTAELANQYIMATDKAYKFGGSVEKLTEVLDGSNYMANHNAVHMSKLAEGMSAATSTAASFGVGANEAAAALGTMIAATNQSGSEAAKAFKTILLNLRQVADEEEGIDAEGLARYEEACNALGVSLKETVNGAASLRDPMEVLKELSAEYQKLGETDSRRTDLLRSVGAELPATQLDALLRQWGLYETMLQQYENGAGSMAFEAGKTADSWEGSMNRLSNTWAATIGNVVDSDGVAAVIDGLNGILSVINSITDKLGSLGTIGAIGGGLLGAKGQG